MRSKHVERMNGEYATKEEIVQDEKRGGGGVNFYVSGYDLVYLKRRE